MQCSQGIHPFPCQKVLLIAQLCESCPWEKWILDAFRPNVTSVTPCIQEPLVRSSMMSPGWPFLWITTQRRVLRLKEKGFSLSFSLSSSAQRQLPNHNDHNCSKIKWLVHYVSSNCKTFPQCITWFHSASSLTEQREVPPDCSRV